jgi:GNAT superfamily N-acetyltransferase
VALKQALRADLRSIVDIWVDAFATDPFQRWIEPDDTRWPAYGAAWMTFVAELTFERGHTLLDDDQGVAVAWIPPDLSLVGPDDLERGRSIMASHVGEARADEALATILTARGHDLEQPHWTLQYLGVRASSRARGVGATAVAPGLAACDRDGLPCGLVSTNARNLSFYERHGFTLVAEVPTPDGTAVLRPMHRQSAGDR